MNVPSELEYSGPNQELVREVIDFAFSSRIVSGNNSNNCRDVVVTDDMVRAVDAAGELSDESRFRVAFDVNGVLLPETWPCENAFDWSEEEGWTGLRDSLIPAYIYTTDWWSWIGDHKLEIAKCEALATQHEAESQVYLYGHLRSVLPEGPLGPRGKSGYYREYIIDQVAGDMMYCAMNRAFNGSINNFWEQLLSIYFRGYWPCCWLGDWPANGKFLAWNSR